MALKPIMNLDISESDLPWVNEYLDNDGEVGDSTIVTKVYYSSKGCTVYGDSFRGFLFKDSAIYGFLKEALEVWVKMPEKNAPLFMIACKGGKVNLALDDEAGFSIWKQHEKGKQYTQCLPKDGTPGLTVPPSNPLLPNPSPTTLVSGKGSKRGGAAVSEIAL